MTTKYLSMMQGSADWRVGLGIVVKCICQRVTTQNKKRQGMMKVIYVFKDQKVHEELGPALMGIEGMENLTAMGAAPPGPQERILREALA